LCERQQQTDDVRILLPVLRSDLPQENLANTLDWVVGFTMFGLGMLSWSVASATLPVEGSIVSEPDDWGLRSGGSPGYMKYIAQCFMSGAFRVEELRAVHVKQTKSVLEVGQGE
jgi:hypothetical protein